MENHSAGTDGLLVGWGGAEPVGQQWDQIHTHSPSPLVFWSPQMPLHDYWKNQGFIRTLVGKVMSLLFNMLSRFVIAFLPKSKHLFISWLQSPSTVIWEPKKIKSVNASTFSPSICHEVLELDAMILVFWMLSFKSAFSLSFRLHQETL